MQSTTHDQLVQHPYRPENPIHVYGKDGGMYIFLGYIANVNY